MVPVGELCVLLCNELKIVPFPVAVIQISLSLSLSALNFTSDWAEAKMTTSTTYKSFSSAVVNAEVGLHIGLYGLNVTLKGESLVLQV